MNLQDWTWIALGVGLAAGVPLCVLLMATRARPALGFWPATGGGRKVFVLTLFRLYCGAMLAVALLDVWRDGLAGWPRYAIGLPVIVGAWLASVGAYAWLGRGNTYFRAEGLVTEGPYALSRNPGYVASLAAAVGLAITAGSWAAGAMVAGLFAIYWLFALNEERWLMRGYGRAFTAYMRQTPRFLDARSVTRARRELAQHL